MLAGILVQFVLRCSLGLAAAMGVTSSRDVTAGFFRVHLWVALGLNTLAVLVIGSQRDVQTPRNAWVLVATAAFLCYVGSVMWLYERSRVGKALLWCVVILDGVAATQLAEAALSSNLGANAWTLAAEVVFSSLALGLALAAMLLGHWYLNTPMMQLQPLQRLLLALMVVTVLRGIMSAWGIVELTYAGQAMPRSWWSVMSLRWMAGIIGTLVLTVMAWQTLKIPNTQSATGILYVVVILAFLGELSAHWLAASLVSI